MSKIFQYPHQPIEWAGSPHDFTTISGDHNLQLGPYTVEATKRYIPGTRFLMWDGRIFKYSRASGTTNIPYHLSGTVDDGADAWSTAVATPAGSRSTSIAVGSRLEDDLAGGYVQLYDSSIDNSVMRGVIGNEVSGSTHTTIYLDYPIAHALTASDSTELFENPYIEIANGAEYMSFLGLPALPVTTTLHYFWIQTYGPCIISGGGAALDKHAVDNKDVVADSNGCLHESSDHENYQHIGFLMSGDSSCNAGPLVMLQLSV